MGDHRSYRDFIPYRYRDVKPPILTHAPGAIVLTSRGAFVVDADGKHQPRPPRRS